jgi:hypothetical protein
LECNRNKGFGLRHIERFVPFQGGLCLDKNTPCSDIFGNTVGNRLLVVSKRNTKEGEEIKYSFTNSSLGQHTEQAIAYMQAQRFFVELSVKEQK